MLHVYINIHICAQIYCSFTLFAPAAMGAGENQGENTRLRQSPQPLRGATPVQTQGLLLMVTCGAQQTHRSTGRRVRATQPALQIALIRPDRKTVRTYRAELRQRNLRSVRVLVGRVALELGHQVFQLLHCDCIKCMRRVSEEALTVLHAEITTETYIRYTPQGV